MRVDDPMSPAASPDEVSSAGVRRVNDLPMYIVGGLVIVFLVIMVLVAADRTVQQHRPAAAPKEKTGSSTAFAIEIAGKQKDSIIPAARAKPPLRPEQGSEAEMPPEGAILIARPENLDLPPTPPSTTQSGGAQQQNDEMQRIRTTKLQQFEEAVKARTSVQIMAPRSPGSTTTGLQNSSVQGTRDETLARLAALRQQIDAQTREDPTAAYQARLQQLQAAGSAGGASNSASTGTTSIQTAAPLGGRNDVAQFDRAGLEDRWKLDAQPEAPRSPYELRAGFVVPATLISGINSDLPGMIMAQVSQDVFDTATGKWKLIPQGSRLVGRYASDVAYGQSRVLVAWLRIVFPDGKAMDIGSMPGADGLGYAGFEDQANNHYVRLFASAFLMSGVTAGVSYSQRQNQNQSGYGAPTAGSALSEALGQQLGQVTAQLIGKNMNIAPTLEIRPGYRFNVIVTKDMTFAKPYRAFDY